MARRRDIIIERSRWICSVLLMSAFGTAIFGVAGADGHGSAWSAVQPKPAHVIIVHSRGSANIAPQASIHVHSHAPATHHSDAPATYDSHASATLYSPASAKGSAPQTKHVHSHASGGYSSKVTPSRSTVADHHAASGSTPAPHVGQAAPQFTAGRQGSAQASVHASHSASSHHHTGSTAHASFRTRGDDTSPSDGAAVSAALGAWTGASVEVATAPAGCPTDTSTTSDGGTVSGADPAPTAPADPGTTGQGDSGQTTTPQAADCGASQDPGSQGTGTGADQGTATGTSADHGTGTGADQGTGTGADGADQGTGGGTGADQGTGTGADGADQGTGGGQDTGTQDNNGQSNTVPGTGTPDQNSQGDSGTGQPGQGASSTGQPGQGDSSTGQPGQGDSATGQPGQGDSATGQPGQGASSTGQPGQGDGGQGQGSQGTTCPTDPSGAGVGGTQGAGQAGGDATGSVTPIVGGSSDNGMSDQTPDTSCDQDGESAPGGPLTNPSPSTGTSGSSSGSSSTVGSGPLTAVLPGQNGSSSTPTLPTVPITISPAPSTNPVTVNPNPVTVNPNPVTVNPNPVPSVNPRPKTNSPVTSSLTSNGFSLTPGALGNSFNGIPNQLTAPAIGGSTATGIGAGAGAGAGLGALTPATSQIGVRGSGKTSHKANHAHSSGSNSQSQPLSNVPGAQALVQFVDRVPEWAWLALAGLGVLAAIGFGAAFRSGRRVRRQASAIAAASAAALTDPLTGVVNRRGFTEAVDRELARARRYHRPFVLAYVDVRGLKAVNDTEGHLAGDGLLKSVAGLLHDSARADDVVGRLGGDELGLLLVEQSAEGAEAVTHRIQSLLPERRARLGLASAWDLTIGTAAYPQDGESFNELLATADRRLYEQRGIEIRRA
jgi:diguanylate cyclase (GGDEF)-like protein